MRIIAGKLGGRSFDSPKNSRTHPMSDKMRGALFNALGDIDGLTVFDTFAGSGALGLEALSRSATSVTFIEHDKKAQLSIAHNISLLGVGKVSSLAKTNVAAWLAANPGVVFDIVLCDPPYDDLQLPTIERLQPHVAAGGLLVVSWPGKLEAPRLGGLAAPTCKNYGDGQLVFYRRIS